MTEGQLEVTEHVNVSPPPSHLCLAPRQRCLELAGAMQ